MSKNILQCRVKQPNINHLYLIDPHHISQWLASDTYKDTDTHEASLFSQNLSTSSSVQHTQHPQTAIPVCMAIPFLLGVTYHLTTTILLKQVYRISMGKCQLRHIKIVLHLESLPFNYQENTIFNFRIYEHVYCVSGITPTTCNIYRIWRYLYFIRHIRSTFNLKKNSMTPLAEGRLTSFT